MPLKSSTLMKLMLFSEFKDIIIYKGLYLTSELIMVSQQ